jgi:hypothetical protein
MKGISQSKDLHEQTLLKKAKKILDKMTQCVIFDQSLQRTEGLDHQLRLFRRYSTMAKAKKNTRKPSRKTKFQFHTLKSLRKSADNWMETAKDYNGKYVRKPLERGKDFVEDLIEDPREVIEGLVDDGRGFVKDVRKSPRRVFNRFADNGKDFVEDVREDVRGAIDDFIDDGKGIYRSIERDARYITDGIFDNGKRFVDKVE